MNADAERALRRVAEQPMPSDCIDAVVEVSWRDLRELYAEYRRHREALETICSPRTGHLERTSLREVAQEALRERGRPGLPRDEPG